MDHRHPPAGSRACGQGDGCQGAQHRAGMGAEPSGRRPGAGAASGVHSSDCYLCTMLVAGCPAETHPRGSGHRGRVRATSAKLQPWTLMSTHPLRKTQPLTQAMKCKANPNTPRGCSRLGPSPPLHPAELQVRLDLNLRKDGGEQVVLKA